VGPESALVCVLV